MKLRFWLAGALLVLAACSSPETPPPRDADSRTEAPKRESVFDPWVGTIDRAENVQQTVDAQAAELRRRVEESER